MTIRILLATLGLFLMLSPASMADEYDPLPPDPRFKMEPRIDRNTIERPITAPYRWPRGDARPLRCSIRREVVTDFLPGFSNDKFIEPAAPLREYEFGFERVGDPATSDRIEAFVRFRFERLSDGKPLRVERPLVSLADDWRMKSTWIDAPVDGEGFSGARIDIDDMDGLELPFFFRRIIYGTSFAVTLPELKEDRVYRFGRGSQKVNADVLVECMCAFGNDEVSYRLHSYCDRL